MDALWNRLASDRHAQFDVVEIGLMSLVFDLDVVVVLV